MADYVSDDKMNYFRGQSDQCVAFQDRIWTSRLTDSNNAVEHRFLKTIRYFLMLIIVIQNTGFYDDQKSLI